MENRKFITCNKPLYVVQRIFYLCFVLFPTLVFAQSSVANKSQIHLTNGAVFFSNEENANKKHVEKIHITSGAQLVISPQTKLTVVQKRKSSSFVPVDSSYKCNITVFIQFLSENFIGRFKTKSFSWSVV